MNRPQFRPSGLLPGETRLDWAERFYGGVAPGTLFRKDDGSLWIYNPGHAPRRIDTFDEFRAQIYSLYDVLDVREYKDGSIGETRTLIQKEEANILYTSPARRLLPFLKALVHEPVVLQNHKGFVVTPPGYSEDTKVFYYVRPPEDPITPREGTYHLETAFSGVPFESPQYRNNLFAWLLGSIYFEETIDSPMLCITGNQRGIGKSKTQESVGYILTGQYPCAIDSSSEEFDKQLSARFREGQRFISFDNIVAGPGRAYRNDRLSRMLTQGWSKRVRILGRSNTVEQSGVLFALNANDCTLDADLTTRSLPVKLFAEDPHPMTPYVRDYVHQFRREIYGELLNLAISEAERIPHTLFPTFRYRPWLERVYPRIRQAFGELAISQIEELDQTIIDLYSWGNDQDPGYSFTANDLNEKFRLQPDRLQGVWDRFATIGSTKTRVLGIENYLRKHVGTTYTINGVAITLTLAREQDNSSPARFGFAMESSPV